MIPFNKPFLIGNELKYIDEAVASGKISGGGNFTKNCQSFFEHKFGFKKCLLTTSCTDALEMTAILMDLKAGDEVIVPSFTFVSTANAFVLRGAKIIFADSNPSNPNIDPIQLQSLITPRTKAIVIVHYAGIACDMAAILSLCRKNNLFLVEDAAQAIDSYFDGMPLGSIGDFSTFSFHETKNLISGEGGMLVVNNEKFLDRAEIIWEKGTNRSAFFRGEIDKYGWVDVGSSFLPSELNAAYLFGQIEKMEVIQNKRRQLWNKYCEELQSLKNFQIKLPEIPKYASQNGHMFYLVLESEKIRHRLIAFLRSNNIHAVFHYQALHKSEFYKNKHDNRELPYADFYTAGLVRLPLYYELKPDQVSYICDKLLSFFTQKI